MRRTKIVATLGPTASTRERISALIEAGVNVTRFNFSHGSHEEHAARLAIVREVAQELDRSVAVLLDLQGPKIRTGTLADGQPVQLDSGQPFTLTTRDVVGTAREVHTSYEMLPIDVRVGGSIFLSDGWIELRVIETTSTDVRCAVVTGGTLRENQGINLPNVNVSAPALTRKDVEDLHFGLDNDVDYVAISFVRSASDVQRVKDLIAQAGKDIPVVAKIERPEAVAVLDDILDVADGIMVARGDLGVEMPTAEVPIVQKRIIEAANRRSIPVITATQMLESMIENPRPTRAEASDVANAIIDGTDAVMLSGETAKGKYPVETVRMMGLIAEHAEDSGRHGDQGHMQPRPAPDLPLLPLGIGVAAGAIVERLPVKAIVVFTNSGSTARLVAQQRPNVPILAFTHSEKVYRRLSLLWGVRPMLVQIASALSRFEEQVQSILVDYGYAATGDLVIMTGGHPIDKLGPTNFLKVVQIA